MSSISCCNPTSRERGEKPNSFLARSPSAVSEAQSRSRRGKRTIGSPYSNPKSRNYSTNTVSTRIQRSQRTSLKGFFGFFTGIWGVILTESFVSHRVQAFLFQQGNGTMKPNLVESLLKWSHPKEKFG